jgi:porphobilinogen synthase
MPFPIHRLRRLRRTEALRSLVRETRLHPAQFILPLFVCPGEGVRREIGAMPGNYQMSIDQLVGECAEVHSLGIGGVMLFGLPESKDDMASGAYDENGIVQRAIRAIRKETPELLVVTDVCNCEYTSHGHCGYVKDGDVDNDTTLQWLAKSALSHARAGADMVAPSDMMDGRVWAIRQALDANGFDRTPSSPTPPSSLPCSTGRSARPPNRLPSSATAAATRWTRPTGARPCGKSSWTSRKAPI